MTSRAWRKRHRSSWAVWFVAIAASAAAVLLRGLFDPWMGSDLPFVTLFGAVAASVWYGGLWPGIVSTVLGFLASDYFFIEPRQTLYLQHARDYIGSILYFFTCSLIIGVGQAMQLAQRRARAGRELLRITFSSIGDAIITTDTEGRVTSLNPVAESLTGWTQEDAVGRPLVDVFRIVNDQTRKEVENPAARALREGGIVGLSNHTVLIARDGTERPLDDSAAPIRNEEGEAVGCVLVFRDITARRNAEEALRLSERRFRLMADAAPVLIWLSGTDKLCTWFNRQWLDFVGRPMEQEIGNGWAENVHPDDFDRCLRVYTTSFDARRPFSMEYRLKRHDGEYRWVLDNGVPLHGPGGEFTGYIGSCIDITTKKQAEDDLRRAGEQTRSIVDNVIDGIITINDRGVVQSFNPAAERLFGYPPSEIIGRNVRTLMPEPYVSAHDDYIGNYLRTGERKIIGIGREVVGRRKDGSIFPMDLAVSEFSLGGRRHFTGIVRDISERKRTEAELRDADRRKNEFLATLAHELRNPLAPIRNASEILMAKGPSDPVLVESRRVINRQVRHMTRLLDDLLDMSRLTYNKLELRKDHIELADVVQAAVETSRTHIDGRGQELTIALPPQPVRLFADPVRLAQVLSNLLDNAARYSEPGGHIRLTCEVRDGDLVVSVKDDGVGIPAEMLPRVFDMFSQAQRVLPGAQDGLGIGLSLVRGLVERHGGDVEARSDGPGRGSEFIVRLPVGSGPSPLESEFGTGGVEQANLAKRRILIVDDLRDSADSLAMLLKTMGHEVLTAYDGEEALIAAESFAPDVILLDIAMPRLSGYDACRRIRQTPWGGGACIVALTGGGQKADRRRAEEAGFDHHIVKPVEPGDLMRVLASHHSGAGSRQAGP